MFLGKASKLKELDLLTCKFETEHTDVTNNLPDLNEPKIERFSLIISANSATDLGVCRVVVCTRTGNYFGLTNSTEVCSLNLKPSILSVKSTTSSTYFRFNKFVNC